MGGYKTNSGDNLKRVWNIPAVQVRYHKDGYVLFKTKEAYEKSSYLKVGNRLNVRNGIWRIPGYIKMK
jgi:hypothetical protein